MVRILSKNYKEAVAKAIAEAEKLTSAELVCVIAPASDPYQGILLLYGLIAGSVVALGLWAAKIITVFPLLLAIQLAFMALLAFTPFRDQFIQFVPKGIRHHRAARRAYEEYLIVSQHVSAQTPIALIYISLAERYVHILTSRSVREKIPDKNWNGVIDTLAAAMRSEGLQTACIHSIRYTADLLAPHFPEKGEAHRLDASIKEIRD